MSYHWHDDWCDWCPCDEPTPLERPVDEPSSVAASVGEDPSE